MAQLIVKAFKLGYYDLKRRRPGDPKTEQFILKKESHFSPAWMVPVGWTPKAGAKPVESVEEKKARLLAELKALESAPAPVAAPAPVVSEPAAPEAQDAPQEEEVI